ncbi:hypothetical protein VTI74DRAFT_8944 [Chaetomium olivicolor]
MHTPLFPCFASFVGDGLRQPRKSPFHYVGDGLIMSAVFAFHFNGVRFAVVATSPEDETGGEALVPSDYRFGESIEGEILTELSELAWGEFDRARDEASEHLEQQLAQLAADACLPTMQHLVPTPIPDTQTLQDYLYPQTYNLQVLTGSEGEKLTCRALDGYAGIPELHPPVSEDRLRAMGLDLETTVVPVVKASQVISVRRLQSFVWKVTVDGEEMICKSFEHAIGEELATYVKIRSAGVELRVPELKGIVQSHKGVIGILLGHIPHKHHNLRALLASVEAGTVAPSEATVCLRRKWAMQIRGTLRDLHDLGILWRDIKTDNVLIDEEGDAVVLDFGGGKTMGWVDRDKYGSMEGEEQELQKIKGPGG